MNNKNKWITYIIIILVGGIFGYLFGLRRKNAEIWACVGVIFGFIIDFIFWYIGQKERFENPLSKEEDDDDIKKNY